jgi:hypothetical protein
MGKMKLSRAEKKSLKSISELSKGDNFIPALRLSRNDPQKLIYSFLMSDLIRLNPRKTKEK